MQLNKRYTLAFIGIILFFSACEDVINVSVKQSDVKLVVDAFLNNTDSVQRIRITKSIPYFDSSFTEPAVTTAQVIIADSTSLKIFPFVHAQNGYYEWKPNKLTGDTFTVGHTYALFIVANGDTLVSLTKMNPTVARIDSLRTIPSEGNGPPSKNPGRYVELFAKDLPGLGNFYWIKTFRNDTFLNEIQKLNISQDMGNNSNGQDGDLFIYPKRFNGLNIFRTPYQDGDTVRVEIHSITAEAYFWFNLVVNQNRNSGLFATPPVNIGTNIFSFNPSKKIPLAGFFCMSAVRSAQIIVKE